MKVNCLYCLIVICQLVCLSSCARPTFNTLFQISDGGSMDSRTGLPLHTNTMKQKLTVTKKDFLRQSKSASTSSSTHLVTDQLKSLQLNTTTRLNQTACIALNTIESLQSVTCANRQVKMTFDTAANSAYTYQQWLNKQVKYINGGKEWNCTNSTTGEPVLIMLKLIKGTFKLRKNEITVDVTNDSHITPLVCFDSISIKMTTEQELPSGNNSTTNSTTPAATNSTKATTTTTTATTTTPPMRNVALSGRGLLFGWCGSDAVYLNSQPSISQLYRPGQQIYVSWSLSTNFDTSKTFEVILKRTRITGVAANIISWNVRVTQNYTYLTIPSSLEISTSETYFVDFFWWNCLTPRWQSTNYFRIPTAPIIVANAASPSYHSTFYPGDRLLVSWTVEKATFPANIGAQLQFKRRRSLLADATISSVSVLPSQGSYSFIIPINLERQDNADEYYFRLDWSSCAWITYLIDASTSDTQRFYVPTSPSLVSSSPAVGDLFLPGDTARIAWTVRNFAPVDTSNFVVSLKRYRAFIWDEIVYSVNGCNATSGLCFDTIRTEPSMFSFYYQFKWCSSWYSTGCSIDGNYFTIPVHRTGAWNYNAVQNRASSQLSLLHADCQSSQNEAVRQLCNDNRSMSIDLTCTNCYMKYDYSIVQIDLAASGGVLGSMDIQLYSTTTVSLELLLSANYVYRKADTKALASITLVGFSFSIFGVSFDYGAFLDFEVPYLVELNALGRLSAGLQYQLNTTLQLFVRGTRPSHNISVTLTKINYPIVVDFKANLTVDIALKPTLRVSAIVFSIGITTEGFLRCENLFQYPPFRAIGSNNYDYNPSQPSIYHLSYPTDACNAQHLLRYHIQFGLRNTFLTFDVTLGTSLTAYVSTFIQMQYKVPMLPDSNVYELLSGCLFKIPYNDSAQPVNLYLDIPYNSSFSITDYFKTSIIFDLAKAVNVDPVRILYNSARSYLDQRRQRLMTMVNVSLLPSTMGEISDPTVRSLATALVRNQLDMSSILYTGTKWLKYLNNDLTQQSNIASGVVTTTSTTIARALTSPSTPR